MLSCLRFAKQAEQRDLMILYKGNENSEKEEDSAFFSLLSKEEEEEEAAS